MKSKLQFMKLQKRLVAVIKEKVRNGNLTERGLARQIGVSQPHLHNILKGVRKLSPEVGDQILEALEISLIDLISQRELETADPSARRPAAS